MSDIPAAGDNSLAAQAVRAAAVKAVGCPKCGAGAGFGCKAKGGGRYNANYHVHGARLRAATGDQDEQA